MLISPCFTLPVGCMIKRLLVVELVAVLYWVHTAVPGKTRGYLYERTIAYGKQNKTKSDSLLRLR